MLKSEEKWLNDKRDQGEHKSGRRATRFTTPQECEVEFYVSLASRLVWLEPGGRAHASTIHTPTGTLGHTITNFAVNDYGKSSLPTRPPQSRYPNHFATNGTKMRMYLWEVKQDDSQSGNSPV